MKRNKKIPGSLFPPTVCDCGNKTWFKMKDTRFDEPRWKVFRCQSCSKEVKVIKLPKHTLPE